MMDRLFSEELMNAGLSGDLHWFQEHLNAAKRDTAAYPLGIALTHGSEALAKPPGIVVGTIHSVKGGEADIVYLFPDLSMAGNMELQGSPEQQNSITRLFYVGMTRSRETLALCSPTGKSAVEF